MPEINNSLAAQIQSQPIDIGKTLLTVGQINALRTKSALEEASTAQTQQSTRYNQFLQDQGGGFRPGEANTLAETAQKRAALGGSIGNVMVNDPTPSGVKQAIEMAKKGGIPIDPATEQHLLTAPPDQIIQYGQNLRAHGQSAGGNMEATGETTRNQGRYIPESLDANKPYSNRTAVATGNVGQPSKVDAAISSGRNFDGSPRVTSMADVPGAQQPGQPPQSIFQPSVVKGPDGTVSSSVTPATTALQGQAIEQYKKAGENSASAQGLGMRLDMMEHSADVLNKAGWSSTGAGANAKLGAAKSVNSLLQSVGLPAAIDPNKVANWEDLNKETTRAGFDLARTLGSREAATIVQSSVGAVPSAENTPMGFKLVTSGIRQAIQREKDFYEYATKYAETHRGNTFGADVEFNKKFPADLYAKTAIANAIPPEAVKMMKSDPKLADKFDAKYGAGMSGFILHHDQAR